MSGTTKRRRRTSHPVEQHRRQTVLQVVGLSVLLLITAFLVFKALTVNG